MDGKGYPGKCAGKDIPEFARVVTIADSFDAMTTNRVYRNKLTKEAVMEQMHTCCGTQFDPDYLEKFIELIDLGIITL